MVSVLGVLVLVLVVLGLPHELVLAQSMVLMVSKALQTKLYCRLLVTQDLKFPVMRVRVRLPLGASYPTLF